MSAGHRPKAVPAYDPATLPIGTFGRPHGLRGEIVLHLYNPATRAAAGLERILVETVGGPVEYLITSTRPAGSGWLVQLGGVDTRDAAARLTNNQVRVERALLPPLAAEEFFIEDLWGCAVHTETGAALGVIEDVFWNGAQDVLVVAGEREYLIPVVPNFIVAVDASGRRVIVTAQAMWDNGDE